MTAQTTFTADELLASDPIEEPLIAGGVRCHGGFAADGTYVSPRTRHRVPATRAWQAKHRADFGTELLDLPLDTWPENYPNVAQAKYLLSEGVREPIISTLTRIGTVEGFGAMIRFSPIPDWRACVVESVDGTATAHLGHGLYEAHARDEAGFDTEGGHQQMWYATRDVAFEHPVTDDQTATMLERMGLARPGGAGVDPELVRQQFLASRLFPDLPWELELLVERMTRILLIEISAFHVFAWAEDVLSDTDLVAGDGEAARLVSYIRADETPHVEYLKTALTELRDRTLIGESGRRTPGTELVDAIWQRGLDDSLGDRRIATLDLTRREVEHALDGHRRHADVLERFHALGRVRPAPDGSGRWVEQAPAEVAS